MKIEEARCKRENDRGKEEGEHELKLFSILVGAQVPRGDNRGFTEMAAPHPMPAPHSMHAPHSMSSYFPYSWDQATTYSSHSSNSSDENLQYTAL